MASKATSTSAKSDEVFFQSEGVSLCLLVNRRARSIRVIDFRSGPNPSKRRLVMELARREGAERVFTLVERDEVGTWSRLGFQREGSIPGFYKRSDAWILGATVEDPNDDPEKSGLRPAIAAFDAIEAEGDAKYQAARKLMKEREGLPRPAVRVQPAKDADVAKGIAVASSAGRALTRFEPFGRDVERAHFVCTARGGFSLLASVETQTCFDNAFLELLTSPRTEKEALFTTAAIGQLCDELFERQVVGCFALSPVGDTPLAAAYLGNGFRKTGMLSQHLIVGKQRVDAFIWSRKLAAPSDG